jgi:hypothetical protein
MICSCLFALIMQACVHAADPKFFCVFVLVVLTSYTVGSLLLNLQSPKAPEFMGEGLLKMV